MLLELEKWALLQPGRVFSSFGNILLLCRHVTCVACELVTESSFEVIFLNAACCLLYASSPQSITLEYSIYLLFCRMNDERGV